MPVEYSVSSDTPWIVKTSTDSSGILVLSAETPEEDQYLVLAFKPDHKDFKKLKKLKPGDHIHFTSVRGPWTLESDGEQYRLRIGWPKSYRMPKGLNKLKTLVTQEVRNHPIWCSPSCTSFSPGMYRAKRIIEKQSAEEVQSNYDLCHTDLL